MDINRFSDPSILTGLWFAIHVEACNAITDELQNAFEHNINKICDNFKCSKCQTHMRKFIDTHPFIKYKNIFDKFGRNIGFFQWSWELHNQVNKYLNKYQPSLEEAYDLYTKDIGVCHDCKKDNKVKFPKAQLELKESNKKSVNQPQIIVFLDD